MALPLSSVVSGGPGQEHSASAALQQGAAQLSPGRNVPQTSAETFCCPALHGLLLSTLFCASGTVFCSPQPDNDQGLVNPDLLVMNRLTPAHTSFASPVWKGCGPWRVL